MMQRWASSLWHLSHTTSTPLKMLKVVCPSDHDHDEDDDVDVDVDDDDDEQTRLPAAGRT